MTQDLLMDKVMKSLKEIRVSLVSTEYVLQDIIKEQFDKYNIPYEKEYKLAPRKRVDFLVDNRIAVEVKKGNKKPNRTTILQQIEKYSLEDKVDAIIYVGERTAILPPEVNGKKCMSISLNKNWGFSL